MSLHCYIFFNIKPTIDGIRTNESYVMNSDYHRELRLEKKVTN